MNKNIPTESLLQFYETRGLEIPQDLLKDASRGHFNVKVTETPVRKSPFNRRDFFKICLSSSKTKSSGLLIYNDQEIHLRHPCLMFTNPSVPASVEVTSTITRHFCLFNKPFIEGLIPADVQYACPLFNPSLHPVIHLTEQEEDRFIVYFNEMQRLQESDYPFRWDMIRNLLQVLIYEGIRLQQQQVSASAVVQDRLVNSFFTLLNQQFPVDSPESSLQLLTPAHFADLLHVHVNHLNSVVKKHTGKTTRAIIHERVIAEARALLRNTNWNISEIAYALGFEYPSHFNKYFKQLTEAAPQEFRTGQHATAIPHL